MPTRAPPGPGRRTGTGPSARRGAAHPGAPVGHQPVSLQPHPCGPRPVPLDRPSRIDARDRLLAMLLPDAKRALAVVATAEVARDGMRKAGRELYRHTTDLAAATEELVAQGLSPPQVRELIGLGPDEMHLPSRPGAHHAVE